MMIWQRPTTVLLLTLLLFAITGCRFLSGTHRSYSRTESKSHFYQNEEGFNRLASQWVANHRDDEIVYNPWHDDEVRWNESSIFKQGDGYLVQKEARHGVKCDNFESAARIAGAEPADLDSLMSSLRTLNASSIYLRHRGTKGDGDYAIVGLQESGADYGYLYVPNGHDEAQALISAASHKQPYLIGMKRVEQIAPHWFYFEGKGAL